ncbi:biopolymer transport protein ExbD [bacterium BMS3Abin05]|nr:biopolymer transport protein ExbD [bacterium BMS3Abin05]GBE27620.1 biopolymer transport protein ExbD [bacterium BMS3Bbin03]HDK35421.1 biopolymer transporter ExbD [Bacteroidota bacterium]HDL78719.1 biopolymer transporter ExbD [Bacteroidota bacterium]HDZ10914.1 biopolymer transporter ExbD [Bacteroidota bacterium]
MHLAFKSRKKLLLNITSLIDVLFILLIFFMVTSTFQQQPGMKLELPEAKTSTIEKTQNITIFIDVQQQIFLNDKPYAVDRLENKLRQLVAKSHPSALVLKADKSVPHGLVVEVMDLVRQAGIKKLIIATEVKLPENK